VARETRRFTKCAKPTFITAIVEAELRFTTWLKLKFALRVKIVLFGLNNALKFLESRFKKLKNKTKVFQN